VPGLNIGSPLLAGAVAGYSQRQGFQGGLKVGLLMALFLMVPGLIISTLLSSIPEVGGFLGLSWVFLSLLVIGHSLVLTVAGGVIGGLLSER